MAAGSSNPLLSKTHTSGPPPLYAFGNQKTDPNPVGAGVSLSIKTVGNSVFSNVGLSVGIVVGISVDGLKKVVGISVSPGVGFDVLVTPPDAIDVGVSVGKGVGFSNVGTNIVGISVFIVGALLVGVDVVVSVQVHVKSPGQLQSCASTSNRRPAGHR